jgi:hypothetical protein
MGGIFYKRKKCYKVDKILAKPLHIVKKCATMYVGMEGNFHI